MNPAMRAILFLLASTSLACLVGEMYRLWPMRLFTLALFLPSCIALAVVALWDRWRGDGRVFRVTMIGAAAGFAAAVAYDLFRLPFVFSTAWGIAWFVPPLPLFNVFPQFGAMILNEPDTHSLLQNVIGWSYHFSNGIALGVMYGAMVNGQWRNRWPVAILLAVGLEVAMLLTPYPTLFGIRVTSAFIETTLAAHLIFGVTLGRTGIALEARMVQC